MGVFMPQKLIGINSATPSQGGQFLNICQHALETTVQAGHFWFFEPFTDLDGFLL
jgi:hypothetical protein